MGRTPDHADQGRHPRLRRRPRPHLHLEAARLLTARWARTWLPAGIPWSTRTPQQVRTARPRLAERSDISLAGTTSALIQSAVLAAAAAITVAIGWLDPHDAGALAVLIAAVVALTIVPCVAVFKVPGLVDVARAERDVLGYQPLWLRQHLASLVAHSAVRPMAVTVGLLIGGAAVPADSTTSRAVGFALTMAALTAAAAVTL